MNGTDFQKLLEFMEQRYCSVCDWVNEYTGNHECVSCVIFYRKQGFSKKAGVVECESIVAE